MDVQRGYPFRGRIFPFRDAPGESVPVLFFPVPSSSPYVPFPSPFVMREWDRLDGEQQTVLGTDQTFKQKYDGPLPLNGPGHICGTADEWANGLLFSTYISGGYSCDCPGVIMPVYVSSVMNVDGSIVCDPTTGNVIVSLNMLNENTWRKTQNFVCHSEFESAITVKEASGQEAPMIAIYDQSDVDRWFIEASVSDSACPAIFGQRADESTALILDGDRLRMEGSGTSDKLAIDVGDDVGMTADAIRMTLTGGPLAVAGELRVNAALETAAGAGVDCVASFENPTGAVPLGLRVTCATDGIESNALTVDGEGFVSLPIRATVGPGASAISGTMAIKANAAEAGLVVGASDVSDGATALFTVQKDNGDPWHRIAGDGRLYHAEGIAPVTLGELGALLPIAGVGGLELGYVRVWRPVVPPTEYALDLFVDANGTDLAAHAMDVGSGWAAAVGSWRIEDNSAEVDANGFALALTECGHNEYVAEVDYTDTGEVYARDSDAGLWVRSDGTRTGFVLWQTSATLMSLIEVGAGPTYTSRGTAAVSIVLGTTYRLKIVVTASGMDCYFDGDAIISYTSSTFASATQAGIHAYKDANYRQHFNRFKVSPP